MSNVSKLYWRIQRFDDSELEAYCAEHQIDVSQIEFDNEQHARDYVCEQLNLDKPDEDPPDYDESAGAEIARRADALQRSDPDLDYASCLRKVREKHPLLAERELEAFPQGLGKSRGRR
jgi:hypothetical protein